MLREKPHERPNIYQVLREACELQGLPVPIKDVRYASTSSTRLPLTNKDIRWEDRLTYETKPVITQHPHTSVSNCWRCLLTTKPGKASYSRSDTNAPRPANYDTPGPRPKAKSFSYARDKRRPICCVGRKVGSPNRRAFLKVPQPRPILPST